MKHHLSRKNDLFLFAVADRITIGVNLTMTVLLPPHNLGLIFCDPSSLVVAYKEALGLFISLSCRTSSLRKDGVRRESGWPSKT